MNYEKKHLNIRKTILGVLLFVVTLVTLTGCGQFNVDMKVYEEDDGICDGGACGRRSNSASS